MPTVKDKKEFYELSRKLVFGNCLRQWGWEEMERLVQSDACLPPQISLRSTQVGSNKGQRYRMKPKEAWQYARKLTASGGVGKDTILFDESAPDRDVVLQCEVMNGPRFVTGRYALWTGVGMRAAYERMTPFCGAVALSLLRSFLDAPSMDQLEWILLKYDESVVELSTYPYGVGVLGWNTLFWEVRNW